MARKHRAEKLSGHTILVVDDDGDYREATASLLAAEGHEVLTAAGGAEALSILRERPVDLVLLDYFMAEMTGEEVVCELRKFNPLTQVILQTGYASERPAREMMERLDIQGYCDKSEGPDALLLWTAVGLKAAYTVQLLEKSRRGLRYILEATPDLHKVQPLEELLQGILWQVSGLLGAANTFLAVRPEERQAPIDGDPHASLLAMVEEGELIVRAATGQFAVDRPIEHDLAGAEVRRVQDVLHDGVASVRGGTSILPLRVGTHSVGVMYFDRPPVHEADLELLQLFANQAAVAIHNSQLYQMATLDVLTGVAVRRFFEQALAREVRNAFRAEQPLSMLLVDLDEMKGINDRGGHLAGDRALALVGQALRRTVRTGDTIGRIGGDEFAVVLPGATTEQAAEVAARVLAALQGASVPSAAGALPVRCSLGVAVLPPQPLLLRALPRPVPAALFAAAATNLTALADASLYRAKRLGGAGLGPASEAEWPAPDTARLGLLEMAGPLPAHLAATTVADRLASWGAAAS